jgi:uncharacterized protein|tara:strand:- start:208 stop:573 length:366 start_codon:yes stop_codon:yes gene_type:complete
MDLELYPKNDAPYIEGYGKGYINISGNKISNTVLLLSDKYVNINNVLDDESKNIININIKNYKPDLILYGSIKGLGHESEMQLFLKASNIALEVMQIGSACRTWSVLIGDGRNICAVIETN